MSVFRVDIYCKYMLLAISALCVSAMTLSIYVRSKPIELFLLGAACVLAVLVTLYTWSVKVWIGNGFLNKRTVFGCRKVEMVLINEISVIPLRGRYVFMMLTSGSFLMLSTMLESFPVLKGILKSNIPEKVFASMENIGDDHIARKKTAMKLMLTVIFVLCVVVIFYIFKRQL